MLYYIAIVVVVVCFIYIFSQWAQSGKGIVTVLVLGDMGHSPRMQNHVSCLSSIGLYKSAMQSPKDSLSPVTVPPQCDWHNYIQGVTLTSGDESMCVMAERILGNR